VKALLRGEWLGAEAKPYEFPDRQTGEIKSGTSVKARLLQEDDVVIIKVPARSNVSIEDLNSVERLAQVEVDVEVFFSPGFGDGDRARQDVTLASKPRPMTAGGRPKAS
jgi:hypothetical protein